MRSSEHIRPAARDTQVAGPWNTALLSLSVAAVLVGNATAAAQQKEDDKDAVRRAELLLRERELAQRERLILGARLRQAEAQLDQLIFQQDRNASAARTRLDALLASELKDLDQACGLSTAQLEKLQLAGRGDIKRFFDSYEKIRGRFEASDRQQQVLQEAMGEIQPLQMTLQVGLFHEKSLLYKSLKNTLTDAQRAKYDAVDSDRRQQRHLAAIDSAIKLLERGCGAFLDEHRRQVVVQLRKTRLPRKPSPYDSYCILIQLRRLSDEQLRPLFDATQWTAAKRTLANCKALEPRLQQMGIVWEEEDDADDVRPATAGKPAP